MEPYHFIEWELVSDSSIQGERKTPGGYEQTGDRHYWVEMVSPKLTYAELPKFQECVRQMRHAGGKVNSSCGIHVHVDAANHNRQSLKNLLSIMFSKEERYGNPCCRRPASSPQRRQRI